MKIDITLNPCNDYHWNMVKILLIKWRKKHVDDEHVDAKDYMNRFHRFKELELGMAATRKRAGLAIPGYYLK